MRRANTTVELRDGQSFVIGGLLQSDQQERDQKQLPWLADIPVLGALFSSTSYQKNETDLAIIVTPRLVRPARPGDEIKTPLDTPCRRTTSISSCWARRRSRVTEATRRLQGPRRDGRAPFTGHMLDLPRESPMSAIQ